MKTKIRIKVALIIIITVMQTLQAVDDATFGTSTNNQGYVQNGVLPSSIAPNLSEISNPTYKTLENTVTFTDTRTDGTLPPPPLNRSIAPKPPFPLTPAKQEIHQKFVNVKLIYKPDQKGKGELDVTLNSPDPDGKNKLDLSKCGKSKYFLRISTDYKKGHIGKNKKKLEVWIVQRSLIVGNFDKEVSHFKPIISHWPKNVPFGLFWTWGGWEDLCCYDYYLKPLENGHGCLADLYLAADSLTYKPHKSDSFVYCKNYTEKQSDYLKYLSRFFLLAQEINSHQQNMPSPTISHSQEDTICDIISFVPDDVSSSSSTPIRDFLSEDHISLDGQDTPSPSLNMIFIPSVARGDEEIYLKFLNGALIYRPTKGSNIGMVMLPIRDLSDPLEGTFDLSRGGDTGKYLSISTGYRKARNPDNKGKIEIWFAPRFAVEKALMTDAHHFQKLFKGHWKAEAAVGIFWNWWNDDLQDYDYVTSQTMDELGRGNLYKKWHQILGRWMGGDVWVGGDSHVCRYGRNFAERAGPYLHISFVS